MSEYLAQAVFFIFLTFASVQFMGLASCHVMSNEKLPNEERCSVVLTYPAKIEGHMRHSTTTGSTIIIA